MDKDKATFQQVDFGLIFITILLAGISLLSIYSATSEPDSFYYVKRQVVFYILGFIAMFGAMLIDYRRLKDLSIPMYLLGLILLVLVMFIGEEVKGAQRWIWIAGFNLQPSEFMKIFLVVAIAHLLQYLQDKQKIKSLKTDSVLIVKVGVVSIIPFFLILQQPDLGTSLVLVGIVAIMLLVSGISWVLLLSLILLAVAFITGLVFLYFVNFELFTSIIKAHQLPRIYGWLDPYADPGGYGYQLLQALLAIGSGQLTGRGFSEGLQARGWIPEVHTDFIFAVIGEEFGFIGASVLISIYFILIYRLVQIALTCNDTFGSYLVAGVIGMIVFQVFQNIGMAIGLMPITGLALPFISYGGNALLTNMIALGIVLNVAMRTKEYMFD